MSSTGPPLVIKLPSQTEQDGEKNSLPLDPPKESNDSSVEEEDDWDTFQSFPASGNETAPAPNYPHSISGHSGGEDSDHKGYSASMSPSNEESLNVEDHELGEAASVSHITDGGNQMEECQGPEDGCTNRQQSDEMFSGLADDELLPNIQSDQVVEERTEPFAQPLADVQHTDNKEGYGSPSDEHHMGTSHDYEQGLPNAEPSREHYLEGTDTPSHGNNIEQEIPASSTNDSEVTSVIEDSNLGHHERTRTTPVQSSLSNTDDSENDDKKFPGN